MGRKVNCGPLSGCRVIELAHIMAGPVAGLMLADMGADVIKVEKMEGDDTRQMVPPTINGESAAFMMMNRNKRGIVLDIKQAQGRKVLSHMIRQSDVLIENYRFGTMERLGLGYETLKKNHPQLIYLALSGFGRTGPYRQQGGFDLIAQGMSGLMSITGEGQGRPPIKVGAPITDITAGILGALGVAAAYAHRLKTGVGQKVETSLFEAGITQTYWQSAIAFATGQTPGAMGSAHPLNAPYQAFPTADGWINVGAANQANWERLVDIVGAPELQSDHRFNSNAQRMRHLDALVDTLNRLFKTRTTSDWLEKLTAGGVPAGPVLTITQMHQDPQVLHREMIVEQTHPVAESVKTIGLPVKFSETPGAVTLPAPVLGEHSKVILKEFQYSDQDIQKLSDKGIIKQSCHTALPQTT